MEDRWICVCTWEGRSEGNERGNRQIFGHSRIYKCHFLFIGYYSAGVTDHSSHRGGTLKKIRKGISGQAEEIYSKAKDIFTEIRLFTSGKKEKAKELKKKLGKKMYLKIMKMYRLVSSQISQMEDKSKKQYQDQLDFSIIFR